MSFIFGIVANPRSGELFRAMSKGFFDDEVAIHTLAGSTVEEGQGYLDIDEADIDNKYRSSAVVTGLPRVHTPDGVTHAGHGNGTVLYTSLVLAVHMRRELLIKLPVNGDGISSNSERSREADLWWDRAKNKYGLAEEVEKTIRWSRKGDQYLFRADAYPHRNAIDKDLIVAQVKPEDGLHRFTNVDPDAVQLVSKRALEMANVGSLRKLGDVGLRTIAKLVEIARKKGVSTASVASMRARFEAGVDIDPRSWRLAEIKIEPEVVEAWPEPLRARGNPIARRTIVTITKVPPPTLLYYGKRSNPIDPKLFKQIERLQEQRAVAGWGIFAADPKAP